MIRLSKLDEFWIFETDDGYKIKIRKADINDRETLIKFYQSLDIETIYNRFLSVVRNFKPIVEKITSDDTGFCVVAEFNGEIIGDGEAVFIEKPVRAEVALVVKREWRRKRIGTALILVLREIALEKGIKWGYATISLSNVASLKIAKKMNAEIKRIDINTAKVCLPLTGEKEGCWKGKII